MCDKILLQKYRGTLRGLLSPPPTGMLNKSQSLKAYIELQLAELDAALEKMP